MTVPVGGKAGSPVTVMVSEMEPPSTTDGVAEPVPKWSTWVDDTDDVSLVSPHVPETEP
jgi:hypothetical protein